jgi:hypothetical protein
MPQADQEAMRFLAAEMFRTVSQLDREAAQIVNALLRQRLQAEIAALTVEIRDAEARKDDAAVEKSFEILNKLRERLAQVSAQV